MDPTLHTLICPVAEMGRAAAFYRDVLGLTPGYQSEHWSEFRLGDVRIGLHPCFADTPAPADGRGWVLGFAVADVAGLRAKLEKAGAWVKPGYHDTPSGAVMDFRDPDGNALQAVQVGAKARDLEA